MDQQQLTIDEIQQKIAAAMGITGESDEKQQQLLDKATEVLLEKIFLHTLDQLSDDDKKTYTGLIEKEALPDEIEKFLKEKISDYTATTRKLTDDFVNDLKAASIGM